MIKRVFVSIVIILLLGTLALPATSQEVTLKMYHWWGGTFKEYPEGLIEAFMGKYPDIKIEQTVVPWGEMLNKVTREWAGGGGPDLFWYNDHAWGNKAMFYDMAFNFQPFIERDNYDISWMYDKLLEVCRKSWKGEKDLYALPIIMETWGLSYNREMLKEAGLPYPSRDWTVSDFEKYMMKLSRDVDNDGENDYWGIDGYAITGFMGELWLKIFGGRCSNDQVTKCLVNSPENLECLQWAKKVFDQHWATTPEQAAKVDLFYAGKTAFSINTGLGFMMCNKINPYPFDPGFVCAPKYRKKSLALSDTSVMINSRTKYKEEAWKFMKFVNDYTRESYRFEYRTRPRTRLGSEELEEWLKPMDYPPYSWKSMMPDPGKEEEQVGMGAVPFYLYTQDDLEEINIRQIDLIRLGEKTPEEALKDLEKYIGKNIQRWVGLLE